MSSSFTPRFTGETTFSPKFTGVTTVVVAAVESAQIDIDPSSSTYGHFIVTYKNGASEDFGIITAYAAARDAGFNGTEAEWNNAIGRIAGITDIVQQVNTWKPNDDGTVTIPNATTEAAGLMSAADKTKLSGIDTSINDSHITMEVIDTKVETVSGSKAIVINVRSKGDSYGFGKEGYNLIYFPTTTTRSWIGDSNIPIKIKIGSYYYDLSLNGSMTSNGTSLDLYKGVYICYFNGLMFFINTNGFEASTSTLGFMSAADKTKLDGIASGANNYTLPAATGSALGGVMIESTPTQNSTKAITSGGVYSALANMHNIAFHICTSGEYDSSTGIPTVSNPDPDTFYLVPSNGDTNDVFVEWVYINNAWESFGSAQLNLEDYVDSAMDSSSSNPLQNSVITNMFIKVARAFDGIRITTATSSISDGKSIIQGSLNSGTFDTDNQGYYIFWFPSQTTISSTVVNQFAFWGPYLQIGTEIIHLAVNGNRFSSGSSPITIPAGIYLGWFNPDDTNDWKTMFLYTSGSRLWGKAATTSKLGLMSPEDKAKLDGMSSVIEVSDTEPSSETNVLWIDSSVDTSYQVPTVSEMNTAITTALANADLITETIKQALLQLASKVAYTDAGGNTYYNALYSALYGSGGATPVSISAVFAPGNQTFPVGTSLNELKPYLTVTATYSDNSTKPIGTYTLSGTLAIGSNTVTVSYGNLTTTFTATIASLLPAGYTQLEYIYSGDGYADTGVNETQAVRAEYQVKVVNVYYNKGNHILSAMNTFFPYLSGNNSGTYTQIRAKLKGSETVATGSSDYTWSTDNVYTLEGFVGAGNNEVKLNGETKFSVTAGSTTSSSSNFLLFGTQASSDNGYRFHGRLYYMKIYDANGDLLRDYIPCKNSSNVAGVYDLVNNTFLSSANESSAFTAGPVV